MITSESILKAAGMCDEIIRTHAEGIHTAFNRQAEKKMKVPLVITMEEHENGAIDVKVDISYVTGGKVKDTVESTVEELQQKLALAPKSEIQKNTERYPG